MNVEKEADKTGEGREKIIGESAGMRDRSRLSDAFAACHHRPDLPLACLNPSSPPQSIALSRLFD